MDAVRIVVTAGAVFVALNAVAFLTNAPSWAYFWKFSQVRPAYFGSVWMALRMVRGEPVPPSAMNAVALGVVAAAALLGLLLAYWSPRDRAVVLGALPVMVAFIDANKVVSPQYSLWLIPLVMGGVPATLVVTFTAAHVWHYAETWLYIKGVTTPDAGIDKFYLSAIVGRVLADALLVLWAVGSSRQSSKRRSYEEEPR